MSDQYSVGTHCSSVSPLHESHYCLSSLMPLTASSMPGPSIKRFLQRLRNPKRRPTPEITEITPTRTPLTPSSFPHIFELVAVYATRSTRIALRSTCTALRGIPPSAPFHPRPFPAVFRHIVLVSPKPTVLALRGTCSLLRDVIDCMLFANVKPTYEPHCRPTRLVLVEVETYHEPPFGRLPCLPWILHSYTGSARTLAKTIRNTGRVWYDETHGRRLWIELVLINPANPSIPLQCWRPDIIYRPNDGAARKRQRRALQERLLDMSHPKEVVIDRHTPAGCLSASRVRQVSYIRSLHHSQATTWVSVLDNGLHHCENTVFGTCAPPSITYAYPAPNVVMLLDMEMGYRCLP